MPSPGTEPDPKNRKSILTPWAGAVLFLLFYLSVWPLLFHLVLLPHASLQKYGFRVLHFKEANLLNKEDKVGFRKSSELRLSQSDESLKALAFLKIEKSGFYSFFLSGTARAKLAVNNQIILETPGAHQGGLYLDKGPHFIELTLSAGQTNSGADLLLSLPGKENFQLIAGKKLAYLDLGNVGQWLFVLDFLEKIALLGFGICFLWPLFRPLSKWIKNRVANFPKTAALLLALALFWIIGFSAYYPVEIGARRPAVRVDGFNYFAYLPSLIIHRDLGMQSLYPAAKAYKYLPAWEKALSHTYTGLTFNPETGRHVSDHTIGVSLMIAPFFLGAHYLSLLFDQPVDGFSSFYQYSVGMAALFYTLFGFAFLAALLRKHFSRRTTFTPCICLFLGTNLFNYTVNEVSYSHVYSFALVACFIYFTEKWHSEPTIRNSLILGGVWGLLALVRLPNLMVIMFPCLYGLYGYRNLKEQVVWLWQKRLQLLLMVLLFGLAMLPQLLLWKLTAGSWLINPQAYAGLPGLNIWQPELLNVLFSVEKGAFFWSPILIMSLFGLFFMPRYLPQWFIPSLLFWGAVTWVIASYWLWTYGHSFGHRGFTDAYPVLALSMATLLQQVESKSRATLWITGILLIALVYVNLCLTVQYWQGSLPGRNMTWEIFQKIHWWRFW
ncbi:hypothetical protein [Dethiosulfatarculus sandiegensis]|uniref:hypothetical protein n=1 Tax=Dethiosulfatarculus sandiegensis TaxID=1429043 RepID=UPI0012E2E19D|nr:hypothetical protein [Dethiosulfatarculus sandiegensis]